MRIQSKLAANAINVLSGGKEIGFAVLVNQIFFFNTTINSIFGILLVNALVYV